MKNTAKPLIITLVVAAVLGGILALLLLTLEDDENTSDSDALNSLLDFFDDDEEYYPVIEGNSSDLLSITISRDDGELLLTRKENYSEQSTCYHNVIGLGNLQQDNTLVSYLVDSLAVLLADKFVEENPQDLTVYGLDVPSAVVTLDFEEGEDIVISFGSRSPTDEKLIYCEANGFVFLVNYYSVEGIFAQPKDFAELDLISNSGSYVENIKIERSDFSDTVELRYLTEYAEAEEGMVYDENVLYEFVSPFSLKLDPDKGKKLYSKLSPLGMDSCEYVEKNDDNLAACGFDNPKAVVTFTIDDTEYVLTIGGKLADKSGYYAILSDIDGIYSISTKNAIWAEFTISEIVSLNAISPYILGCKSVDVITAENTFNFTSKLNRFYLNGNQLEEYEFRKFFEQLAGISCDELYTEQTDGTAELTVRFTYDEKYSALFNREYDEYSLYAYDGRKYVMNLNGDTVFKVNAVSVERILEKLAAITGG